MGTFLCMLTVELNHCRGHYAGFSSEHTGKWNSYLCRIFVQSLFSIPLINILQKAPINGHALKCSLVREKVKNTVKYQG